MYTILHLYTNTYIDTIFLYKPSSPSVIIFQLRIVCAFLTAVDGILTFWLIH